MNKNIFDSFNENTLTPVVGDYAKEQAFKTACKEVSAFELNRFFELNPSCTLKENLQSNCLKPELFLQIAEELELNRNLDKYPCQLSALDLERAALAKAVLSGKKLLVCFNTVDGLTPGEKLSYYGKLHEISSKYSIKSVLFRTKVYPLGKDTASCTTSATDSSFTACPPISIKQEVAC